MVFKGSRYSAATWRRDGGGISSVFPASSRSTHPASLESPGLWPCRHSTLACALQEQARCASSGVGAPHPGAAAWQWHSLGLWPVLRAYPADGGRGAGAGLLLTVRARAGWSWRAVRVGSRPQHPGRSWLTRGEGARGRDGGSHGSPGLRQLRGQRGACARGRFSVPLPECSARGCVLRRPWSMQREQMAGRRALRSPRAAAPGPPGCGHGGQCRGTGSSTDRRPGLAHGSCPASIPACKRWHGPPLPAACRGGGCAACSCRPPARPRSPAPHGVLAAAELRGGMLRSPGRVLHGCTARAAACVR